MTIKFKHVGFSANRLSREPYEAVFAAMWAEEAPNTLGHLIPDVTPRDAQVAATIIQWLGSQIGAEFLDRATEKLVKGRAK